MSDENSTPETAQPVKDTAEKSQKVMNRWVVVIGAIMIQLALGAIYAWSAFTTPLSGANSEYGFTKTETQLIFSAGLAAFAVMVIIAGRLMKTHSPRNIALLGGIVLGMGYILGGLVGASFIGKLATIGIIGGAGIGLAYVVPIATGVKWFPDKKGLVTGLAVAGFGFGAFIWILLANPPSILGFSGLISKTVVDATHPFIYTVANVDTVFMIYGVLFLVMVVIGSLFMVNPPEGWKPAGYNPPAPAPGKIASKGFSPKAMMKSPQFWMLWTMFIFGALAGLMVIGNVQNFAKNVTDGFEGHGFTATQAADFAVLGAAICLPIFNGAGRIVWGQVSDKIGRKKALMSMFLFQGVMMALFFYTTGNEYAFYIVAALIGFNFGGNFALFPAATADTFGSDKVGINYGYVFTAYGIGGIAGPYIAGFVQDQGMSFTYAFIPAALMCFVAAGLALLYKPEAINKEEETQA
ncbi:MAG: OFA family MFS transporter [Candidatus Thermoplasmatota archaeon]|nr:OFA family MFS transporter [Euryarchaeota archaeon]MBU4032922.1 OFA family MFS transporter [Candidatus Thermoplasmatota archaeon]MBU4070806.1 OFA family MFS transporter [Candidatus Thermoplasmatota archaeon]MBU4143527.1 OFA family MFS transporter [Candidatus Thermoplasmatota archaeon]MBU4591640.1 OFA family MFS transporter [Candidatus Thermoplasmatota archaeon]